MSDSKKPAADADAAEAPAPTTVQVRVTSTFYRQELAGDRSVDRRRGEVITIPRAEYDRTVETRKGVTRSSCFLLLEEERAEKRKAEDTAEKNRQRFMALRGSLEHGLEEQMRARAIGQQQAADAQRDLAAALKPPVV
jgi:hypothetical protein